MAKVNFDDIKNTVVNAVGTAAVKTRDFAEKAGVKVKAGARIAKLNMDISSKKNAIEKAYTEIGKIYYDLHKNEPESMYVRIFDDIRVAYEDIEILEQEIEDIKLSKDEDDGSIEVEFEEIDPEAEGPAVVNDEELTQSEDAPSCGCSINTNKEEAPSCGCSIDANKAEDAPSCGCSIDSKDTCAE